MREHEQEPGSNDLAIEIKGLTKRYKKLTALDHLDMEIPRGEFWGLLGPNGAGKSTTLKLLTGLARPTEGYTRINGIDTMKDPKGALSGVGCLVETPEFYYGSTPMDILGYTGRLKGLSKDEIAIRSKAVLDELRIYEWRDERIDRFSKGMKQRVGLAQAMISNPSVVILDEPTTGLDPRGMIEFREMLSELRKYDITMLLSTHNLSEVSAICGSVTILRNGRSVASGKVEDLVKDAVGAVTLVITTTHPATSEYMSELCGMKGVCDAEISKDYEIRVKFNGDASDQSEIVGLTVRHGLGLVSISEESGSDLERLYMGLSVDSQEA
ncbi:MAG: ABC transporter ATP-binding protein [Thermoplasmata archaeon]|nr:ABC transporter ATP-binding protein [Thermoplasmata archaeon]